MQFKNIAELEVKFYSVWHFIEFENNQTIFGFISKHVTAVVKK